MNAKLYTSGMDMKSLKHIPEISSYNYNYYVGFEKDLLFAESNDDNLTEWYLVYDCGFIYLGESYTTENEILHRYESKQL